MEPVQDDVEIETSGEQSDVFAVSSFFSVLMLRARSHTATAKAKVIVKATSQVWVHSISVRLFTSPSQSQ